jgi:hypothetical protein
LFGFDTANVKHLARPIVRDYNSGHLYDSALFENAENNQVLLEMLMKNAIVQHCTVVSGK